MPGACHDLFQCLDVLLPGHIIRSLATLATPVSHETCTWKDKGFLMIADKFKASETYLYWWVTSWKSCVLGSVKVLSPLPAHKPLSIWTCSHMELYSLNLYLCWRRCWISSCVSVSCGAEKSQNKHARATRVWWLSLPFVWFQRGFLFIFIFYFFCLSWHRTNDSIMEMLGNQCCFKAFIYLRGTPAWKAFSSRRLPALGSVSRPVRISSNLSGICVLYFGSIILSVSYCYSDSVHERPPRPVEWFV